MDITAVSRKVNDILSANKQYVVPRYQRDYSWKDDQLNDFWEDLVSQIDSTGENIKYNEYFIGCVVVTGQDSGNTYYIVDGQQRLTTITIYLRSLVERLKILGEDKSALALYYNTIEGTDYNGDKFFKIRNQDESDYFKGEIQNFEHQGIFKPSQRERNYRKAYDFFVKKITTFKIMGKSDIEIVEILRDQILKNVTFIHISSQNEDDASTIFETINARGMSLSSVDLIKNYIFRDYSQVHPTDNAKAIWRDINENIGKNEGVVDFYRHFWNSKYSNSSEERLYKSFTSAIKQKRIPSAIDFLDEIKKYSTYYRKISLPTENDWKIQKQKPMYYALQSFTDQNITLVRPLLLALFEARDRKVLDQTTMVTIFKNIEKFHFIYTRLFKGSSNGPGKKYPNTARKIASSKNKAETKLVINDLTSYLDSKICNLDKIISSVKALKTTSKKEADKKTIRIIFEKIENHLIATAEMRVAQFSIEHIADQSSDLKWAPFLGNLLPLDEKLNNEIKKNQSFAKKIETYQKSKFQVVKNFVDKFAHEAWTEENSKEWVKWLGERIQEATRLEQV